LNPTNEGYGAARTVTAVDRVCRFLLSFSYSLNEEAPMFAAERQSHILGQLDRQGRVRVTELARDFQVTEETVRRDLERLELEGKLHRTHGGATVMVARREQPFAIRQASNAEAKLAIARAAVRLIVEKNAAKSSTEQTADQVIALDGSTSALGMTGLLPEIPLTVVTNSVPVMTSLGERPWVKVVGLGGTLDQTSRCLVGPLTAQALSRINVNTLFLSCVGVDLERGLSESLEELAAVKSALIERADRVVLLVDHSKFGLRSTLNFALLDDIDLVITDQAADQIMVDQLQARGVTVQRADAEKA
jgi:DeoR family transcriptional regulator, L-fucose operon activator